MLIPLSQATSAQGNAAANSAGIADGFVLTADAMNACLDERKEQIDNLVNVIAADNKSRVAADLRRLILTVHVPKEVEDCITDAFEQLKKPIIMRLSALGGLKDPLKPAIVLGLEDKKSALDALRMLYAEVFTAENLGVDKETSAAIIIQSMPKAASSYRVIHTGEHTIIEAQQGYGSLVEYGECDRFLFQNAELIRTEKGSSKGIFGHNLEERPREAITTDEAKDMYAYCKTFFPKSPLILCRLEDKSFVCLGCSAQLPAKTAPAEQ